ncbi:hypothetical protein [Synechococcus sp. MIT S1220]|uniref:hypothetical protein n=1 Tax=Synechococcus sp. MIT S1220 TaxID=3082549 RepID=UPI0039AECBEA
MKPIKRSVQPQNDFNNTNGYLDKISSNSIRQYPEWKPTQEQLEGDINETIEEIRSSISKLQRNIKASDRYILGLLDVVADDYRAQPPTGKQ